MNGKKTDIAAGKNTFDASDIDDEHRFLQLLIESLDADLRSGNNIEAIGKVLADLFEYMDSHFKVEEMQMATLRYPELEEHKSDHQRLITRLNELMEEALVDRGDSLANKLETFLTKLLSNHISGHDCELEKWKNNNEKINDQIER